MKDSPPIFCIAFLVLACSAASHGQTTSDKGTSQATQQAKPNDDRYTAAGHLKKPSAFSGLPVVGDFQSSEVEPEADTKRRQMREQRYSSTHPQRKVADPGTLVDGEAETTNLLFIDYAFSGEAIDPQGIPVSVSDAIVVGTVTSGKCFVAADHTFVYTDYTVRIEQILKQDPAAHLSVGNQVIATREGGTIRFPSGHVTHYLIKGQGLPEIGSQYLLFLWRPIASLGEYEIIFYSGYKLKDGQVFPLDDVNSQYIGVKVPAFLDEVRDAIAASMKGEGQ